MLYIFNKTLFLSIISRKCDSVTILKEEKAIEILKILGLVNDMEEYQINI